MKKWIIAGAAVLTVAGAVAAAEQTWQGGPGCGRCGQDGPGWRYDASRAETVSGTVEAVEEVGPGRRMGPGLGLRVATGAGAVMAHLGPKGYFEQRNISFAAGETVELTGVKTVIRGRDAFIVSEVKRGGEVLQLRDGNGRPLWAGWRRQARP